MDSKSRGRSGGYIEKLDCLAWEVKEWGCETGPDKPSSAQNPNPRQKGWAKPVVLGGVKSESELRLEKKCRRQ